MTKYGLGRVEEVLVGEWRCAIDFGSRGGSLMSPLSPSRAERVTAVVPAISRPENTFGVAGSTGVMSTLSPRYEPRHFWVRAWKRLR